MVGLTGFEPVTSRLSGVRSNQLSYRPNSFKITAFKEQIELFKPDLSKLNSGSDGHVT